MAARARASPVGNGGEALRTSLAAESHTLVKLWLRMAMSEVNSRMLVSTTKHTISWMEKNEFQLVCVISERDCFFMHGDESAEELTVGPSAGEIWIDQSTSEFATLQGLSGKALPHHLLLTQCPAASIALVNNLLDIKYWNKSLTKPR